MCDMYLMPSSNTNVILPDSVWTHCKIRSHCCFSYSQTLDFTLSPFPYSFFFFSLFFTLSSISFILSSLLFSFPFCLMHTGLPCTQMSPPERAISAPHFKEMKDIWLQALTAPPHLDPTSPNEAPGSTVHLAAGSTNSSGGAVVERCCRRPRGRSGQIKSHPSQRSLLIPPLTEWFLACY